MSNHCGLRIADCGWTSTDSACCNALAEPVRGASRGFFTESAIRNPPPAICRAAVLLEVVLALTILIVVLSFIGSQMTASLEMARRTRDTSGALMLAQSVLAEIDAGAVRPEQEQSDEFGPAWPGYAYRLTAEEVPEFEGLLQLRVQILHGPPDSDLEQRRVVCDLHTQRIRPTDIDLQRDFGLSDEQIAKLADSIPPETGIDVAAIDPSTIATMDPAQLVELLPSLAEAFGIRLNESMVNRILQQLGLQEGAEFIEAPVDGGDASGLRDAMQQGAGGRRGGRRGR